MITFLRFAVVACCLAAGAAMAADALVPIEQRLGEVPPEIVNMFTDGGAAAPATHRLNDAERAQVNAAFAALTPLHRKVLQAHLGQISFADGFPNNALTSPAPGKMFNITVRAGVLHETVSELLTNKERQLFLANGVAQSVSVRAGAMDAIVYVLLHEATHIVDNTNAALAQRFADGVWNTRLAPVAEYRDPLLMKAKYRQDGQVQEFAAAPSLYAALGRTPFVSVYASANRHDDFAELVAWYHLTQKLGQPYRIELRDGNAVHTVAPVDFPLVKRRFAALAAFYDDYAGG